jgi:hypothetical protein
MQAFILLLAVALSQDGGEAATATPVAEPVADCVARRLKPFVSPYGLQQAWPVVASPPPEWLHALGTPLAETGHLADGYQQFLHIDVAARAVYVVEQGGFAGTTKVYGPLPLPRCMPGTETPRR